MAGAKIDGVNLARTRSRIAVACSITVMLTLVTTGSPVSAQTCSCVDAFVGDTIAAADGVFIGTVAEQGGAPGRTGYEVDTWIKGDVATGLVDVESGECSEVPAEGGDEVAVAFALDGDGRAIETCALPPVSVVRAFVQPDPSAGPAVWFATSAVAPPLLLDADARIVASDPVTDNRRIDAAAACADGTVSYLQDQQVVIIDDDFTEVGRFAFRRSTSEMFCPEPGVVLAVAGPAQDRRVYDVVSRAALTSPLATGGPADAVGDLVAGGMQTAGEANATVRVVSRSTGVERTLIDPALLVGARPVTIHSVRLSPTADRVAFTLTSGPEGDQQAAAMVADTAGGSILALAEIGTTASEVRWLSADRLVVLPEAGRSTVRDAGTLAIEREVDGRWIQHLEADVLSGIGHDDLGVGSTLTRVALPDGPPTIGGEVPFGVEAIRLPEAVASSESGSAFVQPLELPLASERLDGHVVIATADGLLFVSADEVPTATPTSTESEAAIDASPPADADGEDAGILMWAVAAGAIAIGGVLLMLARRPQPT